ncbi:hypothetical protein [Agromyces sp. CF514]|uniref:hypothetical protein n=1 Tax=Agromyces sp. CF514 TaxID=1881031 RepID=UPI001160C86B|nr:hypothetical protein [Agromyces sp. CF514]
MIDLSHEIDAADALLDAQAASSLAAAHARPTIVPGDEAGSTVTQVIRDGDESEWAAGRYRITAVCAGEGTVAGTFAVGSHAEVSALTACTASGTVDHVEIEVPETSTGFTATLVPGGGSRAAIGYSIARM